MKAKTIIPALAFGAMALSSIPAQAGPVIDNKEVISMKIKAVGSVATSQNKVLKFTWSNKDLLNLGNYPQGSQLVLWQYKFWVFPPNAPAPTVDLTSEGILKYDYVKYSRDEVVLNNGTTKGVAIGSVTMKYRSDGASVLEANEYAFDLSGGNDWRDMETKTNPSDNSYVRSVEFLSPILTGVGFAAEGTAVRAQMSVGQSWIDPSNPAQAALLGMLPANGSVMGNGSGKLSRE
jgi:hypothetical protein